MKKRQFIGILFLLLCILSSCMKDTSAYNPQNKEDVIIDNVENEQGENDDSDENLPEGKLVPGLHNIKIEIESSDGTIKERIFKYFMPISIDETKSIPLIFEFHDSYNLGIGSTSLNPLREITTSHPLIQHAIKENCIICFPAGTTEILEDNSVEINWKDTENNLLFFDALIEYFKTRTPLVDCNRIYLTGESNGAEFSFLLALKRSNIIAAITPRAGIINLDNYLTELPERAVPIRIFAGTIDEIVAHNEIIRNITLWAEKIGGYFANDMIYTEDAIEISGYKKVDTRIWEGAKADYQIFSIKEEQHDINISQCLSYMWEFMNSHFLDTNIDNLYIKSSIKEISAQCGEPFKFFIEYTDGATINISSPKGWDFQLNDKIITMKAPSDFYGLVDREGEIVFTVSKNNNTTTMSIPYKLNAPKDYFEIGDIYYNDEFEPIGVVFWVNENNIREAKIVNLEEVTTQGKLKDIKFGNFGKDFISPNYDDGEENTSNHMKQNETLNKPLTNVTSGLVWAATYEYKGISNWYLPALNELKDIDKNLTILNNKINEVGGEVIFDTAKYWSSTVTSNNNMKTFNLINFSTHQNLNTTNDAFFHVRAIKKVSKNK